MTSVRRKHKRLTFSSTLHLVLPFHMPPVAAPLHIVATPIRVAVILIALQKVRPEGELVTLLRRRHAIGRRLIPLVGPLARHVPPVTPHVLVFKNKDIIR